MACQKHTYIALMKPVFYATCSYMLYRFGIYPEYCKSTRPSLKSYYIVGKFDKLILLLEESNSFLTNFRCINKVTKWLHAIKNWHYFLQFTWIDDGIT